MWKLVLKGLLAASANPTVRAWVEKKARDLAAKIVSKAGQQSASLHEIANAAAPAPVVLRVDRDVLQPGTVVEIAGHKYRVLGLKSAHTGEALYEAVEVR